MKVKTFALLGFCTLSFLMPYAWAKTEKAAAAKVTEAYKTKALALHEMLYKKSGYDTFGDKLSEKEIVDTYAKYFSETEIGDFTETYKKEEQYIDNLKSATKDLWTLYDAKTRGKDKGEKKGKELAKKEKKKKSKSDDPYGEDYYNSEEYKNKTCKEELDRDLESIQKGISRIKRAFGTGANPIKLDNAEDGKADYDNKMLSYVLDYGKEAGWSKKDNTYSYSCGKTTKSFTYNPKDGSFK